MCIRDSSKPPICPNHAGNTTTATETEACSPTRHCLSGALAACGTGGLRFGRSTTSWYWIFQKVVDDLDVITWSQRFLENRLLREMRESIERMDRWEMRERIERTVRIAMRGHWEERDVKAERLSRGERREISMRDWEHGENGEHSDDREHRENGEDRAERRQTRENPREIERI